MIVAIVAASSNGTINVDSFVSSSNITLAINGACVVAAQVAAMPATA